MNRKKFFLSLSVFSAFGIAALLGTTQIKPFIQTSAEECGHSVIEHYDATATTIEHWACCSCHQAWADEQLAVLVRNHEFDHTRSAATYQVANYYAGGNYGWSDNSLAVYDEEYGFGYTHTLTEAANEIYYEPKNISLDFEAFSSYKVKITNNTTSFVNIQLRNGDWSGFDGTNINIEAGSTGTIVIKEGIKFGGGKPFVLRFGDNYGGTISGSLTVSLPKGHAAKSDLTSGLEVANLDNSLISSYVDAEYGVVYSFNTSDISSYDPNGGYPNIYLRGLAELDITKYEGVELYIYHESNKDVHFTCWSEDWNDHVCGLGDIPSHTWTKAVVTADAWNGDRNTCAIGFYDTNGLSGNVKIAVKGGILTPLYRFLAQLDAIKLNDSVENNAYVNDFYTTLKPVLEEIKATYGAEVPQEIKSHKNYVDYADPTSFVTWDYGQPTIGTENINDVLFAKVTAAASGEQGIISRTYPTNTNAKTFVFSVFNKATTDKAVNVYNGYGDPWNVGGRVHLPAQQWTTITYEKALFDEFDQGFALIFQNCEVGDEFLVSTVVDYCYNIEGDVVYSDNITVRGNDWASCSTTLTQYGKTYNSGYTDSSVEDPEWKCTMLYLSNPGTIDAAKYSHVKFYLYNDHNADLFVALKGIPSQYNFDESGNTAPRGEWKAFTIPTTLWNQHGGHLELILSANNHHAGTVLVSTFVGVAA